MGCLRRIGCLFLFVGLGVVAYLTRDIWLAKLGRRPPADTSAAADARVLGWRPLTPEGASRARTALQRLGTPSGPAYLHVAPADLAAYVIQELSRTLPSSADSVQAAAIGPWLCVRASVRTADLGDRSFLGPLQMLLGDREPLQLCGIIRVIRPGLAEFQVKELKVRDFGVPKQLIPRLVAQISRGQRPPELSPDGMPLAAPEYIGDVRISEGQVTLYKATQ